MGKHVQEKYLLGKKKIPTGVFCSYCVFLFVPVVFFMSLLTDSAGLQELSFVASEV